MKNSEVMGERERRKKISSWQMSSEKVMCHTENKTGPSVIQNNEGIEIKKFHFLF